MNENSAFSKDWYGHTTVHPVGLLVVMAMAVTTLIVPRRYAAWPMIVVACFIPPAQRLVVAGADFDFLRVMVLVGWTRLLLRNELRALSWKGLDLAVVTWVVVHVGIALVRIGPSTLMNKLGFAFDSLGMYLLYRILIRDLGDLKTIIVGFSIAAVPVALGFAVELATARNMFAVFGGVPEMTFVRDGRLRCQGAFAHPILAGLFWASLLPLFAAQWLEERGLRRWAAGAAVLGSLLVVVACGSAAPLSGVVFAVVGGMAFVLRNWMRWIRWGLLLTLVSLHVVMKAPVWHLISRVQLVGGSSGYHRFQLIDGAIRHADEWWLFGSDRGTGHWGHHTFDVTNYYIVQGLHGGLLLLALFVAIIALGFGAVGRSWRSEPRSRANTVWSWAMGVSLFVHTTSLLTISYFGQIFLVWYVLLAAIGSLSPAPNRRGRARPFPRAVPFDAPSRQAEPGYVAIPTK